MQIDLDSEELHWLRYALLTTIAPLPADRTQLKTLYSGILEKLGQADAPEISENLADPIAPPRIFLLDRSQAGDYRA